MIRIIIILILLTLLFTSLLSGFTQYDKGWRDGMEMCAAKLRTNKFGD